MTIGETTYFGLTTTKNQSPSAQDWAVTYWNWYTVDTLLYHAAVAHQHTGAAALGSPVGTLVLTPAATGGTLPAGTTYYVCVTYKDSLGKETAKSTVVSVTTDPAISPPATPTYTEITDVVACADALTGRDYYYKISYVKGGGETTCSDPLYIQVPTDQTYSATIHFTSINTAANGADKIFVYRKVGTSGSWTKLVEITNKADTSYTDDNTATPTYGTSPVTTNTTNAFNKINIDWSALDYSGATTVCVYVTTITDSSATPVAVWSGSTLLAHEETVSGGDTSYDLVSATLTAGQPPASSQCFASPGKITLTAGAEIEGTLPWANLPSDFCWQLPVANDAALPATGVDGEARIVKDVGRIQWWNDTLATPTWDEIEGGIEVVQLNELFNIQTDFDTKVLPYLPSNPTDGQLVAVRNSNLTWGIFPRAVYLYMWRNDWDTPAWQLVNQVLPLADSEGNYTNYSAPVGTMWVYNNGGTCTLRVMQPSGSSSSIPSTYVDRCSELAYWGFFDTPEDLTYVNDVSSYMSTGEVAFVLDTHSFYYYDDTLATPAWVKGPGVIKTEETIADVTLSATPTDIELKINDILEKLRTAGVIEAE